MTLSSPPAERRISTRLESMQRRRPTSTSIRHSACWLLSSWHRSPGPLCNGRRYSAEQNGEIKGARSFQNQMIIILGSLIVTGLLLALLAYAFEHAIGTEFLYVVGAGYWAALDAGKFNGVFLWPNIVAMALGGQPDHRGADRLRLHPQLIPDRQQLLYRHDPSHGGHVARSAVAGMGEPGLRPVSHPGQRPLGVLSSPASR